MNIDEQNNFLIRYNVSNVNITASYNLSNYIKLCELRNHFRDIDVSSISHYIIRIEGSSCVKISYDGLLKFEDINLFHVL